MEARRGFDIRAAAAMKAAMGTDDPTFIDRLKKTEFWGLYDPEPVGAVVLEENVIHVASTRPCGLTVRRLVNQALRTREILFAPIPHEREAAARLALALGFKPGIRHGRGTIYWRASCPS